MSPRYKFFILSLLLIILNAVPVTGENVALYKTARQSTNLNPSLFPASRAVNGIINRESNPPDISHTNKALNQYWTVDLAELYYIKEIVIYNRADCCGHRLQQIYVLTSDQSSPSENAHPTSSQWTIAHYIAGIVGDREPIPLYLTQQVRHVAVFSQHDEAVTIREVQVFNYQSVEDAPQDLIDSSSSPSQSSFLRGARRAANGDIGMFDVGGYSSTASSPRPHWWKAQLSETCNNCVVKIYPFLRRGNFPSGNDFSRLDNFRVMSSDNQNPGNPSTSPHKWVYCGNQMNNQQNGPIRVTCSQTNIKHISVYKDVNEALELTEVQVFHPEPPAVAGFSVTGTNSTCVSLRWNSQSSASYYRWRCESTQFSGKIYGTSATSCGHLPLTSVTCFVIAVDKGGISKPASGAGTPPCLRPSEPQFTVSDESYTDERNIKRRLSVTITNVEHNCNQLSKALITNYNGDTEVDSKNFRTDQTYYFTVDPNTAYRVVVSAENDAGFQSSAESTVTTSNAVPDVVASFSVTGSTSECVKLNWTRPALPASINRYEYKCDDNDQEQVSSAVTTVEVCGYRSRTTVTCWIRAVNSMGTGKKQRTPGRTLCGAPTQPTDIRVDEIISSNRLRLDVSWQGSVSNCDWVSYEINVRQTNQPQSSGKNKTATSTYVSLYNNLGGTEYTITITAVNNDGRKSTPLTHTFLTQPLDPEFGDSVVTVEGTSPHCFKLSWQVPQYPNGIISKYQYSCESSEWQEVDSSVLSTPEPLCDFEPYTRITCEIQAKNQLNSWSSSKRGSGYTLCDKPSNINFTVSDLLSSDGKLRDLTVTIKSGTKPNCDRITKYEVFLWKEAQLIESKERNSPARIQFDGVSAFTKYDVKVFAYNNNNNRSDEVVHSHETGEAAPGSEPQNFIIMTNTSCAKLTWKEPSTPNGIIIEYQLTCSIGGQRLSIKTVPHTSTEFCNLQSASKLECEIYAKNNKGAGPVSTTSKYTKFEGVISVPKVAEPITGETIPITLIPVDLHNKNAIVEYYQFIVEKEHSSKRKRREINSQIQEKFLSNKTLADNKGLTYYIAGRVNNSEPEKDIKFQVGDGKYYNGYYNAPLERGVEYRLHYSFSALLDGVMVTQIELFPQTYSVPVLKENDLTALAALVVIPIIIVVIVVSVILYRRRSAKDTNNKKSSSVETGGICLEMSSSSDKLVHQPTQVNPVDNLAPAPASKKPIIAPVPQPATNKRSPNVKRGGYSRDDVYENHTLIPMGQVSESLLMNEEFIESYISTHQTQIKEQYQNLEKLPKGEMQEAAAADNRGKNRYKGLYPVDDFRVVLSDNENRTDYINASFIHGFSRENKYIAAMAPNENTLYDFWLMIWQQDVTSIVMVTNLVEDGKRKCDQYWPAEVHGKESYGDFEVLCKAEECWADFIIRTFSIKKGDVVRKITQFHYLTWPDHGVPEETAPFVSFYNKVVSRTDLRLTTKPILIHCSAGVGRTGTFIALDYLLEQGRNEGSLNPYECVKKMRAHRPAMVQREEQYLFLYKALLEAVTATKFITDSATALDKVNRHRKSPAKSDISKEFQVIEGHIKQIELDYSSAKSPENKSKNREAEILAADMYRPFLVNCPSNYINAVLMNSYKKQNNYVVTQLPLKNTTTDFWTLMEERHSQTIIQLDQCQESFYPATDNASVRYEQHHVKREKTTSGDNIDEVQLTVRSDSEEARKITVFVLVDWNKNTKSSILRLYEEVRQCQRKNGENLTTVVSMDGCTRSGLYINISHCIEKLELEQEVDVYNPVLNSRLRRPEIVKRIEDYFMIYEVVTEFSQSFSTYSNFQ